MRNGIGWVVGVVVLLIGGWIVQQAIEPDPLVRDPAATAPSTSSAAPLPAPASVETAPGPDATAAVQATRETLSPSPSDDPAATWIVEGRTLRGVKEDYPGVAVHLQLFAGYEATGTPLAEAHLESDHEGRFRWPLRPPTTAVTVHGTGDEPDHYSYGDDAIALPGKLAPSLTIRLFPKDCSITGVVRSEAGAPIEGALVHGSEDETKSDAQGRYQIAASSARGDIYVDVTAAGYAKARAIAQLSGPGSRATANFDLVPGFVVRGRVVDEDGAPVEGATIKSFFTGTTAASSDVDGRFVLDFLDPRRQEHSVYARKPGYCEAETRVQVEGAERTLPDLVMSRGVRLEGVVVDEQGAPIAGASLYLGFSPSAYNRLDARSQEEGRFVFPNVPAGQHTLVVQHPDFAPLRQVLELPPSPPTVSGMVVRLPMAHFIGGVVKDATGTPRSKVWLSVRHADAYLEGRVQTGDDGRFRIGSLPADDVTLELFAIGIVRKRVPLDRLDHETLEIVVEPSGKVAGRVVDGMTGAPLDEFVIRFVRPDDPSQQSFGYSATWAREGHRFTGTDGYWDSGDQTLPPGGVLGIEARAEGYAPGRLGKVVVAVAPDADANTLKLFAGAKVTGRVVDPGGRPVAAARIAIRSADAQDTGFSDEPYEAGTTQSDGDGGFTFEAVAPGPSVLLIEAPDRPSFRDGPFEVPPSGAIDRLVRLPGGGRLDGELLAADGRPLPQEAIVLHALEVTQGQGYSSRATTDAQGRFTFGDLPDGLYQVSHLVEDGGQSCHAITRFARLRDGTCGMVTLQPAGKGAVLGSIVMPDGTAATGVMQVMAQPNDRDALAREDGAPIRGALARDGQFEIDGLVPGAYSITVFVFDSVQQLHGSVAVTAADDRQEVRIELKELPRRR